MIGVQIEMFLTLLGYVLIIYDSENGNVESFTPSGLRSFAVTCICL